MELLPPPRTPPLRTELQRLLLQEARAELWRRGHLSWKLHEDQLEVYHQLQASRASRFVMEIARRWGKTYMLALIAMETCLRRPKSRVVYGAPTLVHLREFILPTFDALIADAPPDACPVYNSSSGHWTFPNGSHIHLFGADNKLKANRGRGPGAQLAIFDEAGFTPVLEYVLESVFDAQLLTTRGRTLIGSTPAEEPEHDFTRIAERAEAQGNYARRTIYDNPTLSPEWVEEFTRRKAEEKGLSVEEFVRTDTWRREYLAERVIDKLLVVVPEWAQKREKLLVAVPRPDYFDAMTVLDPGGHDPHAATFGYWHFTAAKWVIEDELLLRNGENSAGLVAELKAKEKALWGVEKYDGSLRAGREQPDETMLKQLPDWMQDLLIAEAPEQPYIRWSDTNLELVRALYELHGMAFIPTEKSDLEVQVNRLRVMVNAEEILIHPRCVHTDRHLRTTTWENHKRRRWARKGGEHGDCLATLIYGARNLNRQRNPIPAHLRPVDRWGRREESPAEKIAKALGGTGPLARKLAGRR
jgi:hypothetical protein